MDFSVPKLSQVPSWAADGSKFKARVGSPKFNDALDAYVKKEFDVVDSRMTPVNPEATVWKRVVKYAPSGIPSPVPEGSTIFFHFLAYHEAGDGILDYNICFEDPSVHSGLYPSQRSKIAGLGLALKSMYPNQICRFLLHPEVAYGEQGLEDKGVPPGSKLMLVIEMLGYHDEVPDMIRLPAPNLLELPLETVLELAARLRNDGSEQFLKDQHSDAVVTWTMGITLLQKYTGQGTAPALSELLSTLYFHVGRSYLKQNEFRMVEYMVKSGLERVSPRDGVKLLKVWAEAREQAEDHDGAKDLLQRAMEAEPGKKKWKSIRWAAEEFELPSAPPSGSSPTNQGGNENEDDGVILEETGVAEETFIPTKPDEPDASLPDDRGVGDAEAEDYRKMGTTGTTGIDRSECGSSRNILGGIVSDDGEQRMDHQLPDDSPLYNLEHFPEELNFSRQLFPWMDEVGRLLD